jgi:DNA modification methylase
LIEGLIQGDCVEVMAEWPEGSVDAIVCDPPYGLEFMGREWDRLDGKRLGGPDELAESDNESGPQTEGWGAHASPYARSATPRYAGKQLGWKGSASMAMQEWHRRWALEAFRVLKPGGYLIAAGGTRTYHRMAAAVEDAGFEVRDMLIWGHAQGFPKSRDIGRDLDKMAGVERAVVGEQAMPGYARQNVEQGAQQRFVESFPVRSKEPATELAARYAGFGTALKPAFEPWVLARKPMQGTVAANVLRHGTGALNIDGTRIPIEGAERVGGGAKASSGFVSGYEKGDGWSESTRAFRAPQSDPAKRQGIVGTDLGFSKNDAETMHEAQRLSTERLESMGRWPANVILTDPIFEPGTEGVEGATIVSSGKPTVHGGKTNTSAAYGAESRAPGTPLVGYGDTGTYSRFFLVPKAGRSERERGLSDSGLIEQERRTMGGGLTGISGDRSGRGGVAAPLEMGAAKRRNMHPTVKPVRLMRHLVRLVTPPGGVVLDPFLGSGTTAIAAIEEGFRWIGIEKEAEYAELAAARIKGWFSAPEPPVEPLEPEPPEPEPEVDEEPVREPFGPLTLFG